MVVLAKLSVQPDKAEAAAAALRDFVAYVRDREPGTLTYVVHRREDNPAELFVYERYADRAAFDAHTKSARFGELFAVLGPMLAGQPVIETYAEIAGKGV